MKISNINFSQKTVETVEISGDDIKEINFEFVDNNTFRLTIAKDDNEVVQEVFEQEKEETIADEVVEENVIEEEPLIKELTIDDVKKIIYDTITKELELELIQTQMTQKPMLRAEVGMRVRCANKASAE